MPRFISYPSISLFLFIFALIILTACGHVKQPDYLGLSGFKISTMKGNQSLVHVNLDYYNPNHFGVKLKEADFDVFIDDDSLGHASLDSTIHISAESNFSVPVLLSAPTRALLKHSVGLLLNKEVYLRVKGTAKIGKAGIYKRYPIFYEGKQSIQQ